MSPVEVVNAGAPDALARAIAALDAGELVVIPGDVRYLLVADALDDDAVERLFLAKRRAADRPLTACIGGYEDVQHVAFGSNLARHLAEKHWPGPVALVLKARPWLPDALTAGGETVAVMAPRADFANRLARQFGPYVCVGAGPEGGPDARTVEDALRWLGGEARLLVDGGPIEAGRVTVVDATGAEAKLIRAGTAPVA